MRRALLIATIVSASSLFFVSDSFADGIGRRLPRYRSTPAYQSRTTHLVSSTSSTQKTGVSSAKKVTSTGKRSSGHSYYYPRFRNYGEIYRGYNAYTATGYLDIFMW